MLNRTESDGYYYKHLSGDEEFIYFFVKLMEKFNQPIKKLSDVERIKILNLSYRVHTLDGVITNFCRQYEIDWQGYFEMNHDEQQKQNWLNTIKLNDQWSASN